MMASKDRQAPAACSRPAEKAALPPVGAAGRAAWRAALCGRIGHVAERAARSVAGIEQVRNRIAVSVS